MRLWGGALYNIWCKSQRTSSSWCDRCSKWTPKEDGSMVSTLVLFQSQNLNICSMFLHFCQGSMLLTTATLLSGHFILFNLGLWENQQIHQLQQSLEISLPSVQFGPSSVHIFDCWVSHWMNVWVLGFALESGYHRILLWLNSE